MVFRGAIHGLPWCGSVGIATRKMPNGERMPQIWRGEG